MKAVLIPNKKTQPLWIWLYTKKYLVLGAYTRRPTRCANYGQKAVDTVMLIEGDTTLKVLHLYAIDFAAGLCLSNGCEGIWNI